MAEKVASNEDLLKEILLRLSVKPLLRFKCVSKHWLTLISEPKFCHSHTLHQHRSSQPFPTALLLGITGSLLCPIIPLKNSGSHSLLHFRYHKADRMLTSIMQSCNGLLLLEGKPFKSLNDPFKARHFVYNPTTNRFVRVTFPTRQFRSSVLKLFLSFEPLRSPHYKLISIRFKDFSTLFNIVYFKLIDPELVINVYSSETRSWSEPGICFSGVYPSFSVVYCNGAIYWYSDAENSKYFDVENNCFKSFPMPLGIDNKRVRYFGESGGHLHMAVQSLSINLGLDVLELNEERSHWSMRFRVNLNPMRDACPHLKLDYIFHADDPDLFYIFCVVRQEKEDESMLVFFANGKVMAYNLVDSTFNELSSFSPFLSACSMCEVFHYYESLAWVGPSNAR